VQTVIAPHEPEVRRQLDTLPPRLREIAQRYIARLRFEPFLRHRLERGLLATEATRAVYFDRDSRPDDLFGARRPPRRRGNEDLAEGPRFRVVYIPIEARATELRLIVVLAVGAAHDDPRRDVYAAAERIARRVFRRNP
jgi:hypothetical protein